MQNLAVYLSQWSFYKFKLDLNVSWTTHHISHMHHIVEYLAGFCFPFWIFIEISLTNDCSHFPLQHLHARKFCAYREKLDFTSFNFLDTNLVFIVLKSVKLPSSVILTILHIVYSSGTFYPPSLTFCIWWWQHRSMQTSCKYMESDSVLNKWT